MDYSKFILKLFGWGIEVKEGALLLFLICKPHNFRLYIKSLGKKKLRKSDVLFISKYLLDCKEY